MYTANLKRYNLMKYRRCGNSGLMLPEISLGLWHNFGDNDSKENAQEMLHFAFDNGITHFDLANNYGPPSGSAERNFGHIFSKDFVSYRDEMIITSKAGHLMWAGPYGEWGSRKNLIASIDQSLRRTKLDYFDIFYSHRYDPSTPLEETMSALDHIVKSGKALYVGLSKYPDDKMREACEILRKLGSPAIVHQVRYSMLVREPENTLFEQHKESGIGCVSFSPLAQGLLSDRYLSGIPNDSRAAKEVFLKHDDVEKNIGKIKALGEIADKRGQTISQMAISWQLRNNDITSVLVGVSSVKQLADNLKSLDNCLFTDYEISEIDFITKQEL